MRLLQVTTAASCAIALAMVGTLSSCDQTVIAQELLNINRPEDIAFACVGPLSVSSGTEIAQTGQPIASCVAQSNGTVPPGQENLSAPSYYGFVLQPTAGSVSVLQFSSVMPDEAAISVVDADLLTPGKNAIPVGTSPVAIETDPSGCFVVTANAGSCDLTALNVNTAVALREVATSDRILLTASGTEFFSKPGDMAIWPQDKPIGVECPVSTEGVAYVTFPDCHFVGAVDLATGEIAGGIAFDATGSASIVATPPVCASSCGGTSAGFDPNTPMPTTLSFDEAGSRLAIGSGNANTVAIAELDAAGVVTSVQTIGLEGDVGVRRIALSETIAMGGSLGSISGNGSDFQFVYAVATDGTVRVIDVLNNFVECDTQIDPRYLENVTDVDFLSCLPLGDPSFPRRAGVSSPGIVLPGDAFALDVAFAQIEGSDVKPDVSPETTIGYFAYVTGSNGFTTIVNVDDDNYVDFISGSVPLSVQTPLAIAHQVRDGIEDRDAISFDITEGSSVCGFPNLFTTEAGARLFEAETQTLDESQLALQKRHLLPTIRTEICTSSVSGESTATGVSELSFMAVDSTRVATFPDLLAIPTSESWTVIWEGRVSGDGISESIDGPPIRIGTAASDSNGFRIVDGVDPFCRLGAQAFDVVDMTGCNPLLGDAQCGLQQTCYVHPDSALSSGVCLDEDRVDALAQTCRDYLVSNRRYSVAQPQKGQLDLIPRRRVLKTTPIDGCIDAAQCDAMYAIERQLEQDEHPSLLSLPIEDSPPSWVCEADASRAPGQNRCIMSCQVSDDCEAGYHCDGSHCVEAPIPDAVCVDGLQRYELRVGEAYAVLGSEQGFLHNIVADSGGMCVEDNTANPLNVSRIPLQPEPCVGDGATDNSPNPCLTQVPHAESVPNYSAGSDCEVDSTSGSELLERPGVSAVRFRNRSMQFHLVDPVTAGDGQCNGDRQGMNALFAAVHRGVSLSFRIVAGFVGEVAPGQAVYPKRLEKGPAGGMWILDQGDVFTSSTRAEGQVLRFIPSNLSRDVVVLR